MRSTYIQDITIAIIFKQQNKPTHAAEMQAKFNCLIINDLSRFSTSPCGTKNSTEFYIISFQLSFQMR